MLRGRQSLIRLIGKRRRLLPNRQSLLSDPIQITFDAADDTKVTMVASEDKKDRDEASTEPDWVNCPVCGIKVRGEDNMINTHLDACLSRGTKRKLTQRTLFQLNFCTQSRTQVTSGELETYGNPDSLGEDGNQYNLSVIEEPVSEIIADCSTKKSINDDRVISYLTDQSSLSLNDEGGNCNVPITTVEDIIGAIVETFIVGRKYSTEKELSPGASISLSRDPSNIKDPNAIKVILADERCCTVVGFLPRELAQYLSPLMDRYSLAFEGCVISVPKRLLDVVPIQITCREVIFRGDECHREFDTFACLWRNVLRAVESAKNQKPYGTKYQQNFCLLIQEVLGSDHHLFTDDEKQILESFISLSSDCQRLFVRLYTRKGPWFRMSNISYSEILDLQQAIKQLSAIGCMCSFVKTTELSEKDLKEILDLLSVSELQDVTYKFKKGRSRGSRKQDLIASICSSYDDGLCPLLPNAILERTGQCVKISSKMESLIWRVERLFFLNGEQDLSAFLLVDLGRVKYPTYNCIISEQIFSSRSDLLAYEEAIEVAQIMDESLDEHNNEAVLRCTKIADSRILSSTAKEIHSSTSESQATFRFCFTSPWVYSKVVFLGISFLERERRYNDAINLLKRLLSSYTCDGRRGYWTLRLSIDLEHIGCPNESLSVAENGLLDPWVRAGSRMALQRRVLRLGKPPRRWKVPTFSNSIKRKVKEVHIQGRPLNCEAGVKSRFYGEDGEQCGVEDLALQYYAEEGGGWQGVHTETGIWLTIFGVLMWDVLFSDVPNVFRNIFQTAPLDLDTDDFYLSRKSHVESQLKKIYEGMADEILITSWESHLGTACRGVNWDRHSLSELRAAVTCIGGPCLASLCRHLAQDYHSWSSGMPDLLLWRFHEGYRGEAKLVEVKGPKDRLSEQQRAWLLLLMDCGFDTEVCKVSLQPV